MAKNQEEIESPVHLPSTEQLNLPMIRMSKVDSSNDPGSITMREKIKPNLLAMRRAKRAQAATGTTVLTEDEKRNSKMSVMSQTNERRSGGAGT